MGKPLNNLQGFTFGSLTVLQLGESRGNGAFWLCQCKCGTQKEVRSSDMVQGKVSSCGCEHSQRIGNYNKTHGLTNTRTYRIWNNMKTRCKKHIDYAERGIKVCDEWLKFDNFVADMGLCPDGMSLDRINVNGNYEKSNCRWATQEQQMNNTRANVWLEFDNKRLTVAQWARELNIKPSTLKARVKYGFPIERILDPMIQTKQRKKDIQNGVVLNDAEGNTITSQALTTFINTLP